MSVIEALNWRYAVRKFAPEIIEEQVELDDRADGDGRVGDVECRPVVSLPVDIEEVDHLAEADPVDQVAHGAGEDQRQGEYGQPLVVFEAAEVPENTEHGNDRHGDEKRDA